ncbi:MAG: BTAD domain-containing putative transcriptional regulator, partial [Clostridiaceae bacterium]|nr:BTAD domain-containing putative transcriptional regulator [Clostridiaceae bacterium]
MINLEICMLGNPTITLNNKPILNSMSNKAVALLCYMVLNKDKMYSRDKLASIFWDSANIETARYNLRYNLWSLRKILDADKKQIPVIETYKDCCKINSDAAIYTDIFEMEKLLEENLKSKESDFIENLNKVKNIYKGEFLEGFYINKCPEFNDWVFFERERLQIKYFEVLHRLTKLYKSAGNYLKSIEILNEMLKINPLQEELYEELIKNYLELGDRGAALNQYKRCSNILRDELNIGPNESIRKLYHDIKNSNKSFQKSIYQPSNYISSAKLRVIFIDEKNSSKKLEDKVMSEME